MKPTSILLALLLCLLVPSPAGAQSNDECFDCHDDPEMEADDGRILYAHANTLRGSAEPIP